MQTERTKDRKTRQVFNKKDNLECYISQRHSWLNVKDFFLKFY